MQSYIIHHIPLPKKGTQESFNAGGGGGGPKFGGEITDDAGEGVSATPFASYLQDVFTADYLRLTDDVRPMIKQFTSDGVVNIPRVGLVL